jgi:alpha-galactosidase
MYPHGIRPVADAAHGAGLHLMMWFEAERVCNGTRLAAEHPEFVLQDRREMEGDGRWRRRGYCQPGFGLFNMGNPAARAWMVERVSALIAKAGIDHYRQARYILCGDPSN